MWSGRKHELIAEHHDADNAAHEAEYAVRGGSGDGDEMATYAWFVLLRYEPGSLLRSRWLDGWATTDKRVNRAGLAGGCSVRADADGRDVGTRDAGL
jgi:hypothetical protein